jgi:magnesium transporter
MVTEFLAFPEDRTIGEVLDELRRNALQYSDYDVQYVYITSAVGELVGVLRLRDVVLAGAERKLTEVMLSGPLSFRVDTPLQSLVEFFDDHAFFGVPGVLDDDRLVGVVKRSATREAMAEQEVGGSSKDRAYRMSTLLHSAQLLPAYAPPSDSAGPAALSERGVACLAMP